MSSETDLKGFHEANIDHIVSFDLIHKVLNHAALLIICDHDNKYDYVKIFT